MISNFFKVTLIRVGSPVTVIHINIAAHVKMFKCLIFIGNKIKILNKTKQ